VRLRHAAVGAAPALPGGRGRTAQACAASAAGSPPSPPSSLLDWLLVDRRESAKTCSVSCFWALFC
jgi:hypothetical protein